MYKCDVFLEGMSVKWLIENKIGQMPIIVTFIYMLPYAGIIRFK